MSKKLKHDLTRLNNLLDKYRDYMITSLSYKLPYSPAKLTISVDNAISTIKIAINKE